MVPGVSRPSNGPARPQFFDLGLAVAEIRQDLLAMPAAIRIPRDVNVSARTHRSVETIASHSSFSGAKHGDLPARRYQ